MNFESQYNNSSLLYCFLWSGLNLRVFVQNMPRESDKYGLVLDHGLTLFSVSSVELLHWKKVYSTVIVN